MKMKFTSDGHPGLGALNILFKINEDGSLVQMCGADVNS
jgi:hypothetical protein